MQQRVRVQNFTVSADGYATGEGQSLEQPFGHADPGKLLEWAMSTASWPGRTDSGGSRGVDDYFCRDFTHGIGAEIMGRNKFGPQRGAWQDHEWHGWWGRKSTVPYTRVCAHPPPQAVVHARRHYLSLSQCHAA